MCQCHGLCVFPQLQSEVEKPLLIFRGDNFKKDMKKYEHNIADLRKQLLSRYAGVEKVRVPVSVTCAPSIEKLHLLLLKSGWNSLLVYNCASPQWCIRLVTQRCKGDKRGEIWA